MIFLTIKHAHFQMLVLLNIMHNGVVDKVSMVLIENLKNYLLGINRLQSYPELCFLGESFVETNKQSLRLYWAVLVIEAW